MTDSGPSRNNSPARWLTLAAGLVLLVVVALQWRAISQLQKENNRLRAQRQTVPPETEGPSPTSASAANPTEPDLSPNDKLELLRLRNAVRELREQTSTASANLRPAPLTASAGPTAAGDEARQLVVAAMHGDGTALDKLANLAASIRTLKAEEQPAALAAMKSAFEFLGVEAGKGDASALQALWQASRVRGLQAFAAQGLGQAAGLGNEEALKPLLDPDTYQFLRSSAVAALKPAADAGNERAIQALAATATDPKQQALWLLAAQGLESAAASGNAAAIDGLANIAAGTNQMLSKEALFALEAAARKNQPRAEEVLRRLGWR